MSCESNELPEISSRRICSNCIEDAYLKPLILAEGIESRCYYCTSSGLTWSMQQLAVRIANAFERHFQRTATGPDEFEHLMSQEGGSRYKWEREGYPVLEMICDAAGIHPKIGEDIRVILAGHFRGNDPALVDAEEEFDEESYYEVKPAHSQEFHFEWDKFEESLKKEVRFFSSSALATLNRVFEGVNQLMTLEEQSVIVDGGPGRDLTGLYRARVFLSDPSLKNAIGCPDRAIGPPPPNAATAGRMNAAGISVFYGAKDVETAKSEVRPPVGSYIVTARFNFLEPVRLLDIDALGSVYEFGSYFDDKYLGRLERVAFLRSLGRRISKAVLPDDEVSGYLVTQAIADYLANVVGLDGVIYRSVQVQASAANVVLFHHASAVEPIKLAPGTRISAQVDDYTEEFGYMREYCVWENEAESLANGEDDIPETWGGESEHDRRKPRLRIDTQSIKVHHVLRATYVTDQQSVHRIRRQRNGPG